MQNINNTNKETNSSELLNRDVRKKIILNRIKNMRTATAKDIQHPSENETTKVIFKMSTLYQDLKELLVDGSVIKEGKNYKYFDELILKYGGIIENLAEKELPKKINKMSKSEKIEKRIKRIISVIKETPCTRRELIVKVNKFRNHYEESIQTNKIYRYVDKLIEENRIQEIEGKKLKLITADQPIDKQLTAKSLDVAFLKFILPKTVSDIAITDNTVTVIFNFTSYEEIISKKIYELFRQDVAYTSSENGAVIVYLKSSKHCDVVRFLTEIKNGLSQNLRRSP